MFVLQSLTIAPAVLPPLLALAGAMDLVSRSIPNRLILLILVSFGVYVAGAPLAEILAHAACAFLVLIGGFALFAKSLIGAGDAKLLSAVALWFGFDHLVPLLAATALAGGVLALAYVTGHLVRVQLGITSKPARTIPYGAAIAFGALAVYPGWLSLVSAA